MRNLFADAALSAAFVPVFTELLEKGRKREAFQLASTFFVLIVGALTAVTIFFIVIGAVPHAAAVAGDDFTPQLDDLMVGLSQVLFPIVLLLGLNGLLVGILNAYDHFTIPALAPLVWNFVIIGLLVVLKPQLRAPTNQLYAYAIAVRRRDVRAALDGVPGAAPAGLPLRARRSTSATRACARCSCSCCR